MDDGEFNRTDLARSMTAPMAMRMLAQATMADMTVHDRQAYQGCESENPMIGVGELDGRGYTLVLDGHILQVERVLTDEEWLQFSHSDLDTVVFELGRPG